LNNGGKQNGKFQKKKAEGTFNLFLSPSMVVLQVIYVLS